MQRNVSDAFLRLAPSLTSEGAVHGAKSLMIDSQSARTASRQRLRISPKSWVRHRAKILAAVVVFASTFSCTKATLGRQELQESLTRHYLDLRWGRIASAARYMQPELQEKFVGAWEANTQAYTINEFDVTHIIDTPDGEGAEVYIEISLVDQNTLTLKRMKLVQKWIKTEAGWRAAELLPVARD